MPRARITWIPPDKKQISFYKSSIGIKLLIHCQSYLHIFLHSLKLLFIFIIDFFFLLDKDHDQFDLGVEFLNENRYLFLRNIFFSISLSLDRIIMEENYYFFFDYFIIWLKYNDSNHLEFLFFLLSD